MKLLIVRAIALLSLTAALVACGNSESGVSATMTAESQPKPSPIGDTGTPHVVTTGTPSASPAASSAATPAAGAALPNVTRVTGEGATISMTKTVDPYRLQLTVGPPRQMYPQAQAQSQHPTSGQVILGGSVGTPGSPATTPAAAGGNERSVAIHVFSLTDDHVVPDLRVNAQLVDNTASKTTDVPLAVLQGVNLGAQDLHYGNNVGMTLGHNYTLNVTVNDVKQAFTFTLGTM